METKFSLQARKILPRASYRNFDRAVKLSGVLRKEVEKGYVQEEGGGMLEEKTEW